MKSARGIIADFNDHPITKFTRSLLDIRDSGTEVLVPEKYTPLVKSETARNPHYDLTRELLPYHLLPASSNLTPSMKECIGEIASYADYDDEFDNYNVMKADTSFWVAVLTLNRGASKLYYWEHTVYRAALNDYLTLLQDTLLQCTDVIHPGSFEKACQLLPSINYLFTPLRFWLGGAFSEIYGSETLFFNYMMANYPMIPYSLGLVDGSGKYKLVGRVNPFIIETQINEFFKINNELERNIVHDPYTPVDGSYMGRYTIYWWFPKPLSTFLDLKVRESKSILAPEVVEPIERSAAEPVELVQVEVTKEVAPPMVVTDEEEQEEQIEDEDQVSGPPSPVLTEGN